MKKEKLISKIGIEKPDESIGEAKLINGEFWIIQEEIETDAEKIIKLLIEIKDLLKK